MLLRKVKQAEKEAKELQARGDGLLDNNGANLTALKDGLPVITVNQTRKKYNFCLRNEISKRVEVIDLTFNAEILSAPQPTAPSRTSPREMEMLVAQASFVNGVTKWAIFDAEREIGTPQLTPLGNRHGPGVPSEFGLVGPCAFKRGQPASQETFSTITM
jgi:hypothetical protein